MIFLRALWMQSGWYRYIKIASKCNPLDIIILKEKKQHPKSIKMQSVGCIALKEKTNFLCKELIESCP